MPSAYIFILALCYRTLTTTKMYCAFRLVPQNVFSKNLFLVTNIKYLSTVRQDAILKSSLPDVEIPNLTIPEFILPNFVKYPNKIASECAVTGKKFSFDDVLVKSRNLNRALRTKLKLVRGDTVALLLPNVAEYPICVFGALWANLKVTTINPLYTPDEIGKQLNNGDVKVIITLGALSPVAAAAIQLAKRNIPIIVIKMQETEALPQGTINLQEFLDIKLDVEDLQPVDANEIAALPYSSGTTGLPKGVELTHRNIVANICQVNHPNIRLCEETTDTHQDVIPVILPLFHIFGLTGIMLVHMFNLCKMVAIPKFTPELFIKVLLKHNPQILIVVPPIVNLMTSHFVKKEYLSLLRVVFSGAAPLGIHDEEKLIAKIGNHVDIKQGYGLTETSPAVCMSSSRSIKLGVRGSVGELVPNTSVKLVKCDNDECDILSPCEPGELLIKGPQVMNRYHNRPEETKNAFKDGWFKSGDLGYCDENGIFYITERLKELIKVKGFQVAPAELEDILRSYPDVLDAAVIGVNHKEYGEVPRGYIVTKPNHNADIQKIQEYVSKKVANFKQLKGGVCILESIPKTPSGKIIRKELKERYESELK